MQKQIRINKTPEIERILIALKTRKYPLMEENEIVKYLLSKDYTQTIRYEERVKNEKQQILNRLYKEGEIAGQEYLKKKGLSLEDITEDELYELVKTA